MSLQRNPTDRFQKFEDYYNSLSAYGSTGDGWPIQLWKKKSNGELAPLTLNENHVGANGQARIAYDFLPGGEIPVIIAKFSFSTHDVNAGLSKVYWYFPGMRETETLSNPFELKRGVTYYMWNYYSSIHGDNTWWRMVYPAQMPGFLDNLNNGNEAASNHNSHDWLTDGFITAETAANPIILDAIFTQNLIKWIGIIVAGVILLMLLIKFVF